MAVQAQYPSNVLLLNRNGQDGHDYSLQPQPGGVVGLGGGFLDQSHSQSQSHLVFNNIGNNNSRKRGREREREIVSSANTNTNTTTAPINLSHNLQQQQQPRPPLLFDLSKIHNHHQPNVVVSTGLRLSSGDSLQNHHNNLLLPAQSSPFFSLLTHDFASNFKHQQHEIDQFLLSQEEQLRRTLAEKRQRHYRALLDSVEGTVMARLREREAEVEKATRRNAELEARAAQLSVEAQVWQAKARAEEATAVSLQAQLQKAMTSDVGGGGIDGAGADDAESGYNDPGRVVMVGPSCKACRKRTASVVILPCRHLCLCTECDQVVQSCPICLSLRNSSVEVYLS